MQKKIYLIICALITVLLLTGCENLYHDAYNSANPNVHVVGMERGSGQYDNALYWKNGELHRLTNYTIDGSGPYAMATSVFVYDGKAYIAGTDDGKAFYSVDAGELIYLTGGVEAKSVFVYKGNIYIAGMNTSFYPDIWKNGITLGLTIAPYTTINSLFVLNGVVYAAGTDQSSAPSGVYWISTTKKFLTGITTTYANSIFVYQGNIYISGRTSNGSNVCACYWDLSAGNNPIFLSSVSNSNASSIFVSEGDVYVAGYVSNQAVYWKNGQINYLSDNESYAESIFVYNNDVYVAGRVEPDGNHEVATYWKNGEAVTLYNGTYNTQALSIFVSWD